MEWQNSGNQWNLSESHRCSQNSKYKFWPHPRPIFEFCEEVRRDDGDRPDPSRVGARKIQNSRFGRLRGQILNFEFCKERRRDDGDRPDPRRVGARKIQNCKERRRDATTRRRGPTRPESRRCSQNSTRLGSGRSPSSRRLSLQNSKFRIWPRRRPNLEF